MYKCMHMQCLVGLVIDSKLSGIFAVVCAGSVVCALVMLNPPFPVLKAGHPVCILLLLLYFYLDCLSVCTCGFLSCCGCLLVSVYTCKYIIRLYASLYSLYMYITAYCFFLLSFPNASVLYTYFPCIIYNYTFLVTNPGFVPGWKSVFSFPRHSFQSVFL